MIVEYIRYTVAPDRSAAFLDAYAKAETVLQQDPHCLAYEVAQSHEEPSRFIVRLEWDSLAGHLSGFRQSPAFADFLAFVRPYVADIEEMHHYDVRSSSPAT